jgi:Ca2+-dependent lipid-binding protein
MHSSTDISYGGTLHVKVKEARLFRDTETFGKMDPYVILEFREHKFRTKTHESGGKNPKWHDEFELKVNDLRDEMKFTVFDEDPGSDDKVGYGVVKMSALCINHGVTDWFSIYHNNKPAGQVLFETRYNEHKQQ